MQLLSTEMKSFREETKELRALVQPFLSSTQPISAASQHVTLPELRAMTDLAKTVDHRVEHLSLLLLVTLTMRAWKFYSILQPHCYLPRALVS